MSIEAMKQALEALIWIEPFDRTKAQGKAITSLSQAIEQAEKQEPAAFVTDIYEGRFTYMLFNSTVVLPVGTPFYLQPPQRQPLTDEQRDEIAYQAATNDWHDYKVIDAVEAAHGIKEKNGG